MNKGNGCCPESGYDKFEQQVREEFIEYAYRKGYDVTIHPEYPWVFKLGETDAIWRAYLNGHVRGRMFDCGEEG